MAVQIPHQRDDRNALTAEEADPRFDDVDRQILRENWRAMRTNRGAVEWLHPCREMRDVTDDDVRRILLNPFYAIEIAPILAEPHDTMVSEEQWVAANAKLINEIGAEAWLRELLAVLKGDFVTAPTGTANHLPQGNRAQRRAQRRRR